jgi:amino acid adenylation domain-containing protein/thioester reductase-like protein
VYDLPKWAPRPDSRHWNKFYKSGDLCYYNQDGTIEFSTRKDTQIKIRGLRVELGEVQHHIQQALPSARQVAVDVYRGENGTNLVAYLCFSDDTRTAGISGGASDGPFLPLSEDLQSTLAAVVGQLSISLPRYMIPTMFIPCSYMPFITSTKLDRNELKKLTSSLDKAQIAQYSLLGGKKRSPETPMEVFLQKLWSELLGVPVESIGRDDSFLGLGGDSITAIHMVSAARESGVSLAVKEIFDDPRLSAVASKAREIEQDEQTSLVDATPFYLVDESIRQLAIGDEVRQLCDLTNNEEVEDAYPVTMFQEGLMALSAKQPGSYIAKYAYRLSEHVDVARFKAAWETTVSLCPTLRTRLVLLNGKCTQVVVKGETGWQSQEHTDVHAAIQDAQTAEMTYGSHLSQAIMVNDASNGNNYFIWTVHHAVHDGWTVRLIMTTLQNAYNNLEVPDLKPYSGFIQYLGSIKADDTINFWTQQLQGASKASYPPSKPASAPESVTRLITKTIQASSSANAAITKATIMRATWAILLARYCDTDDVTLGTSISGRQAPVSGLMDMPGPVVATVPVRVRLDRSQTISKYLQAIQSQAHEMVPYEQYGLTNIGKINSDFRDVCDFTSLLVVQPRTHLDSRSKGTSTESDASSAALLLPANVEGGSVEDLMQGYFSYPLVIQGHLMSDSIELVITYDSSVLSEASMEAMCHQFEHVASQLFADEGRTLGDLTVASSWDLERARAFNSEAPMVMDTCIHHLIEAQVRKTPDLPAVWAWDGQLTYRQLNEAANRLAHYLINEHNVQVEDLVHVCFEKSVWHWVSVLAINKAGAVWVPLDPSHPEQRLRQVASQTQSTLALTSDTTKSLLSHIIDRVVEVSPALFEQIDVRLGEKEPQVSVSASNAAYILFTSGSTGTPKGLVMTHGALTTSQTAIKKRMGTGTHTRALQFASYVFDMSVGEGFVQLISGACIFIPSEHTRMNGLKQFITEHRINSLWLTPSFIRTLSPEQVPTVDFVFLAGEAIPRDVFTTWCTKVRLWNGWGPAETCVVSSLHEFTSLDESPLTIGRPIGGYCWIVDPTDHTKLAPIGTMGEVVIQSPTILREYLADVERTKASTVYELPEWAPYRDQAPWSRFFKSGDLASYNPDGTLEFASRKDTQVKIRGLRVELGEIEHHVRSSLTDARQVAVDVFRTDAGTRLIAYFCYSDVTRTAGNSQPDNDDIFLPVTEDLQRQLTSMVSQLHVTLPRYMVPSLFIPCRYMPFITSTKLDRNRLKKLVSELSQEDHAAYSLSNGVKRMPDTEMEARMQELWSVVLHMPKEEIGCDESFLQIGGDSITAIQLVTNAREAGISIAVKDIFDDPRLSKLALVAAANSDQSNASTIVEPFSLLGDSLTKELVTEAAKEQCNLAGDDLLDDAYPCTKLQEGLMALAIKQPGSYIAKYVYQIPDHVDVSRFRKAWERTVQSCANLRTRMVLVNGITVQVLLKDDIEWDNTDDTSLETYARSTLHIEMGFAQRLCRYALIEEETGNYFAFSIHHTIFDGWSLPLVMGTLSAAYYDLELPSLQSYAAFVKYTMELDHGVASDYWEKQLKGAKRASFPAPSDKSGSSQTRVANKTIGFPKSKTSITKASILRAAWAIVLARYSDSDDVCFGTTVSGRNANVAGLEAMPGLVVATVPVRIHVDKQKPLSGFLQDVQKQANDMVDFEQFGIQNISRLGSDAKDACDFTSLLAIQPVQHMSADSGNPADQGAIVIPAASPHVNAEDMLQNYFSYPLVIQCHLMDDHVNLVLVYDTDVLEETQLNALMQQFDHVVQQLSAQGNEPLGDVSISGPWDLEQALQLNSRKPDFVHTCLHDIFSKHALSSPHHEAIYSSEGSLTYGELDHLTDILATHLSSLGAGPETVVPFCFEKSMWAVVAILAILKAGAAFVPLDPSHPTSRREALVKEVSARVLVASSSAIASCKGMFEHVVELSPSVMAKLAASVTPRILPKVGPRNTAYVLFTSGSTGKPKGVVMQHGSFSSTTIGYGKVYNLSPLSRVFQFSNYIFDGSLGEIFGPLAFGGTICIPSEDERLGSAPAFMSTSKVNTAMLTPSFVRTFTPDQVPHLTTLVLGGEAASKSTLEMWVNRVTLYNGYGPAEACNYATTHVFKSSSESPRIIGSGFNGACWVVEPDNHNILAPIGCTGELVLQGHALARGYLNDKAKTEQSFVSDISSLPSSSLHEPKRFYLTGDLVRYNSNGKLEYLGRKDSQVKLRGQRLELGEIEYNITQSLKSVRDVAVDVIHKDTGDLLVAFISFSGNADAQWDSDNLLLNLLAADESMRSLLDGLREGLKASLPGYMVPSIILPLRCMPFITSMKLDKKPLLSLAHSLSIEYIAAYSASKREKVEPASDLEFKLRDLWAQVLKLEPGEIGRNDAFLEIGGDSISAIHLVTAAQQAGISITVANIFADSRLSSLAASAKVGYVAKSFDVKPFSMLPGISIEELTSLAQAKCNLPNYLALEDAYPCTSLQEGLMAIAIKQPGSYIAKHVYQLPPHVDVGRFKTSWERTVEACSNLRTRIILVDKKHVQVVVKDDISWDSGLGHGLESYIRASQSLDMKYGSRLCRYALIQDEETGDNFFSLSVHHTIFDGWSLPLILGTLNAFYRDTEVPALQPYSGFVKYTLDLDETAAVNYWTTQLSGAKKAAFPPTTDVIGPDSVKPASQFLNKVIEFPRTTNSSITKATILRTAWAIVLARYSDSDDICFGTTVSGRHASVPGLEATTGLVVATVPVRVRLDTQQSVAKLLRDVQIQASEMVEYEQYGLQNISKIGAEFKDAVDFSSLLAVQPIQHIGSTGESSEEALLVAADSELLRAEEALQNYFNYPLVVQCHVYDDMVNLMFIYDPSVLSEHQLQAISQHYDHVVQQLLTQSEETLSSLSLAGPWDLQQVLGWNASAPELIEACVHDLISDNAQRDPNHEAIFSSEGSMTYAALDRLTDVLASHLCQLGVGPETIVPFCFEKSMWAVVAIVGILKAGGVFVPLDPSHPINRREALVKEVGAQIIIASESAAASCAGMAPRIVQLSSDFMARLSAPSQTLVEPRRPSPSNAAYVLFTSGSTGKPKGVVMEHSALTTSTIGYGRVYELSPASRVFQFSNYIFDGSLGEILATLTFGGTVCIPDEVERLQDAPGFVRKAQINTAMLTPSFVRTFTPDQVPSLKTLVLGGEPAGRDILDAWCDCVKLINGYGPAEACNYATWHPFSSSRDSPRVIGKAFNSSCWVVEPNNHHALTPVGCVGELAIQGHVLARGYINDLERTRSSFVTEIASLSSVIAGPQRFYLTGDLVRYCSDGSLEYLGRKDTQVKLRGQRIELGEVEYHVQRALPDIEHAAVDIITREAGQALVAFVSFAGTYDDNETTSFSDNLIKPSDSLRAAIVSLLDNLKAVLPAFMMPSLVLPVRNMPFITSMKLDRKQLRTLASSLSPEELATFAPSKADKVEPTTDMELKLRDLWAQILGIPAEEIGKNDSFLQIGGDSISAIHLVTLAQETGISLTVATIFADPRLSSVAASAHLGGISDAYEAEPFSLIQHSESDAITREIEQQCKLSAGQSIEDAYPTTKLQEGLMALSVKQPGSYTARYVYRLPDHVDVERFKAAWDKTVEVCHNLRTSIVLVGYTAIQAVIKDTSRSLWEPATGVSLQSYMKKAIGSFNMGYGSRLCRYALIEDGGSTYFAWHIHHSVYDGWTHPLIMGSLYAAYFGTEMPPLRPFARFVKYTTSIDQHEAAEYWRRQLHDARPASFPAVDQQLTASKSKADVTRILRKAVDFPRLTNSSITKATIMRAAWSIVLAQYCGVDDVCFGTTLSGRHAPVPGLDSMPGPMLATVPVRIRLAQDQPASRFLQDVQIQAAEMVAYEQFGLQNIAALSPDAKQACDFSSLLVIQPAQQQISDDKAVSETDMILLPGDSENSAEESMQNFANYPLVLQIAIMDSHVELLLIYDTNALTEFQATAISEQFGNVARQLVAQDETLIGDVKVAGSWDLQKQLEWNHEIYGPSETTLHDLFSKQVARRPAHQALYSSEGSMTYSKLDRLTTQLAVYLSSLGVRPETIVPFCFDKSIWAIVAMIGILKAGGVFMPLDPSYPASRRQALIDEVNAQFMIVSPTTAPDSQGMVQNMIELSPSLIAFFSTIDTGDQSFIKSGPNNAAYVLFTSGSTGKPKGVVIDHKAISAALLRQREAFSFNDDTRTLQFANFVFDACIAEIFSALVAGATVCVPTEHERVHNTAAFIREARINHAFLTPTFIKTLSPEQIPGMKTVILMGEAPSQEIIDTWADEIDLHNGYGPAEGCVGSTNNTYSSSIKVSVTNVGRSFTHGLWIVDPDNHNRLMPIGCVGELLLQGSSLARGYINDEEKSRQSFIDQVEWLPANVNVGERRFYKTGDLVRYTPDGSIEYVSRKDTQVKIRGQRIELGEIEYHVKRSNASIEHVVVDITRQAGRESLLAFVCFSSHQETESASKETRLTELTSELRETLSDIATTIASTLPSHMVPKYLIPVDHMPHNAAGKLDRKMLLASIANLTPDDLSKYLAGQRLPFRDCSTDVEFWLRNQWASTLDLPAETIGMDDNFYSLGGDSIRIVTISKAILSQYDVSLGMSLLNSKHTTIANMAKHIDSERSGQDGAELGVVDINGEISSLSRSILASGDLNVVSHSKTELPEQATVFLTGATGFLGQELLRQLLCNDSIASIIALVRSKSANHGMDRLRDTAKIAGWWREEYTSKIEIWCGDLSKKRMGLSSSQWARLAGQSSNNNVDAIIHNGAIVNWNADYDKMRAANVDSTVDLLKATVTSPASPKFVFVSGGIKSDPTTDRTALGQYLNNSTGYIQTKFVSEGIIQEVIKTLPADQNRISTLKPGRIIGSPETGVANVDDVLWRIVSAAASLGVYPAEPEDHWVYISDVDTVASSVLSQLYSKQGIAPYVSATGGMPATVFWDLINKELDVPCEPLSQDEWTHRALESMNQVGDKHPLWPVQHFLGNLGTPRSAQDIEIEGSEHKQWHMAVKMSMRYLMKVGFIQTSTDGFAQPRRADTFQRHG